MGTTSLWCSLKIPGNESTINTTTMLSIYVSWVIFRGLSVVVNLS